MDIERKQTDGAAVDAETACRELTLALLFMNRMREVVDKGEPPVWRAWKGYDFGVLDELESEGLVWSGRRSKSVCFTKEGLAAARRVLEKYGIGDWPKWAEEMKGNE